MPKQIGGSFMQSSFWDINAAAKSLVADKDFLRLYKQVMKNWEKGLTKIDNELKGMSIDRLGECLSITSEKISDWNKATTVIKEIYDELETLYYKKEAEKFKTKYFETARVIFKMLGAEISRQRQVGDLKLLGQETIKRLEKKLLADFDKISESSETRFMFSIMSFRLSSGAERIYQELKKLGEKNMANKFKADYEAMLALQAIKLKLIKK